VVSPKGSTRINPAFTEWMMGLPEGWTTSVPGLSDTALLKMHGNGVVPQQAALAVQLLADMAGRGPKL
jgi:DNA (cytosine-5)-methyltransferase 1